MYRTLVLAGMVAGAGDATRAEWISQMRPKLVLARSALSR